MSYSVVYLRLQCGVQGCDSILRIRTLLAFDKFPHEEASAMLETSLAHAIACGNGHILTGPIVLNGLAFDASFDEDWEMGEGWSKRPARLCAEECPHNFQTSIDPHLGFSISHHRFPKNWQGWFLCTADCVAEGEGFYYRRHLQVPMNTTLPP
jgi:hypothetical protein